MPPQIIAFGHRKRTGKDTAARFLCSHLRLLIKGSNIQVAGFADKGKDICYDLYKWAGMQSKEYYEIHTEEKEIVLPAIGKTPRQIWIEFMSLVGREVYSHTWLDYLFHNSSADLIIIKDMRFPNEADRIRHYGGLIVKINRPTIAYTSDIADDPLENYTNWTHIINNDDSLSIFHQKIIALTHDMIWLKEKVA